MMTYKILFNISENSFPSALRVKVNLIFRFIFACTCMFVATFNPLSYAALTVPNEVQMPGTQPNEVLH